MTGPVYFLLLLRLSQHSVPIQTLHHNPIAVKTPSANPLPFNANGFRSSENLSPPKMGCFPSTPEVERRRYRSAGADIRLSERRTHHSPWAGGEYVSYSGGAFVGRPERAYHPYHGHSGGRHR